MRIDEQLAGIQKSAQEELSQTRTLADIEALRVKYLGKKSSINDLMQLLRECTPEERPLFGQKINSLKEFLTLELKNRHSHIEGLVLEEKLAHENIDITLPGRRQHCGGEHVVMKVLDESIEILRSMGFSVQLGPDIEKDYYNFEALNFPPDHPARDMQDTFYISSDILLRTHTSNTQVRVMESSKLPIRMIAPGRCFRNEDVTPRSHVVFHQIEGVYVDEQVTFGDLLSTLGQFYSTFFGQELTMRYRPSFFPFVEPGVEVDISCLTCGGKGCGLCKHTGWLEVAGAGMIHPNVLKSGGVDPEKYSGYAWGMGIERLALLRYGISDIRLFFTNDMRLLEQFS